MSITNMKPVFAYSYYLDQAFEKHGIPIVIVMDNYRLKTMIDEQLQLKIHDKSSMLIAMESLKAMIYSDIENGSAFYYTKVPIVSSITQDFKRDYKLSLETYSKFIDLFIIEELPIECCFFIYKDKIKRISLKR